MYILYIFIIIITIYIYIYKQDLALDNQRGLICLQNNQTKPIKLIISFIFGFPKTSSHLTFNILFEGLQKTALFAELR